ncbi:sigma-54-dependent Fis family transcriptional regulator [Alcaligenes parafaecalis]|uniref:Sigma-54-dependent Fis family transcriptional regulator n=1 Tax=Alcaligenes parafaecalis TaxID=171260 RepID=A0ABT3VN52_9BURK|nr:sigma-54-dependent Fis family transcriptional regulator [Alcaligenes parafaecalis]MCX5464944.1 sigma-54-dependent Fis family transcriptional regulator [Alcaligenes parafaecalis]
MTSLPSFCPQTNETMWRQSWERCQTMESELSAAPRDMSQGALRQLLEQQHHLMHHSSAAVQDLAALVHPHRSLVLLCDAQGTVLQQAGDPHFLQRAEQVALRAGVSWAENHRGTNAIGTALVCAQPIKIHGSQHYLPDNRILSCHAAPIYDPYGQIIGVLDISGPSELEHHYALDLAQLYARQISRQMLESLCTPTRRLLHLHTDPGLLNSAFSGRLVLEDDMIVAADELAAHLLRHDWQELPGQDLNAVLEQAKNTNRPTTLHLSTATKSQGPARSVQTQARTQTETADTPQLSPQQENVLEPALRAMQMGLSILLSGPSGSGKERMARELHRRNKAQSGPFVAINCAALPETLIEAELFGYEAGAFTGARRQGYAGKLRQAHGGVLFLDEIGDMPVGLQSRLLRVLQEREVQALGSERTHRLDFQLISASHQPLETLVRDGRFRADLYFRLQDYICKVPSLRERSDLGDYISQELAVLAQGQAAPQLHPEALLTLQEYDWPGNYRQLRSVLLQIIVQDYPGRLWLAQDLPALPCLGAEHPAPLPAPALEASNIIVKQASFPAAPKPKTLKEQEYAAVQQALEQHQGNISQAARALGLHRSTLHRRLKEMTQAITAGDHHPESQESAWQ